MLPHLPASSMGWQPSRRDGTRRQDKRKRLSNKYKRAHEGLKDSATCDVVYSSSDSVFSSSSSSSSSLLLSSLLLSAAFLASSSSFFAFSTSLKAFHFFAKESASDTSSVMMTLSKIV